MKASIAEERHKVLVVVAETRRVRKIFRDINRVVVENEPPQGRVPGLGDVGRENLVVAGVDVERKAKFEAELFCCSTKNKARLSAGLDLVKEGLKMPNLLSIIWMWNTVAMILFGAVDGGARNILGNA